MTITIDVERLAGQAVELDHLARGKLEDVLDRHAGAPELDLEVDLDVAHQVEVAVAGGHLAGNGEIGELGLAHLRFGAGGGASASGGGGGVVSHGVVLACSGALPGAGAGRQYTIDEEAGMLADAARAPDQALGAAT